MLAVLPFDVLRLVIDNFTIPRNGYEFNYQDSDLGYDQVIRDTRSTLASLCLTSKIMRQIARPLLLAYFPINAGSRRTTNQVLQLLDIYQALSYIRTIFAPGYFDEFALSGDYLSQDEKLEIYGYSRPLMKLYSQACKNLEKLICYSDTFPLNAFTGSNLRILCLEGHDMGTALASLHLPSLQQLSLVSVFIPTPGLTTVQFPSLRHFAFGGYLYKGSDNTLNSFASQIDSVSLFYDEYRSLKKRVPSLSLDQALVNFPISFDRFAEDTKDVVHLRLETASWKGRSRNSFWNSQLLESVAYELEGEDGCAALKSIYLATSICRAAASVRGFLTVTPNDYEAVVRACEKRGIEVIFEDQAIDVRAETQLSEEFMRRMTRKRIEKDARNGE